LYAVYVLPKRGIREDCGFISSGMTARFDHAARIIVNADDRRDASGGDAFRSRLRSPLRLVQG